MVDYGIIGKRIKERRKQKHFTQKNLAEKCNLTIEYLSKIENGKSTPTIDTLGRICEVLDYDMANLFAGSLISLQNYKLDDISEYYQVCKPEVKPIALEIVKKLSNIE